MDWFLLISCLIVAVGVGMVVVGFVEKNKHKSNKQYHTNLIIIGAIIAGIGLIAVIAKVILNSRKKNAAKNMMMNYGSYGNVPQDMGYGSGYGPDMYPAPGYGPQDMYGPGPQDMGLDSSGMVFDQYGNPIPISSLIPSAPATPAPAPVAPAPAPVAPAPAPVQTSQCAPQQNNCCNSMPMNPFNMGMMNPMMGGMMNPMMGMSPWMMYPQPPVFKVKCSKDD
jgi:F0F1-type ATP synthase membrane subunit c/vacuolar-type H+-ATPase subunit K